MTEAHVAIARTHAEAYAAFDESTLRSVLDPNLRFRQLNPGDYLSLDAPTTTSTPPLRRDHPQVTVTLKVFAVGVPELLVVECSSMWIERLPASPVPLKLRVNPPSLCCVGLPPGLEF